MTIERHRMTWRGRADGVTVLTFMPRFPSRVPLHFTGDAWVADFHLPDDARIEYRLEIRRGNRIETTLDPTNPEIASNPFGMNSVLTGSRYRPAGRGQASWEFGEFRVSSTAFGGRRHHHLLSPSGVSDRQPLPLLLLHDGSDYRNHAGLEEVLAHGVANEAIPPLRVAMLDPRQRNVEYAADPRHAAHVMTEVIPRLRSRLGIDGRIVIGGASLGAVASWHAVWSHPGTATGLVLQSGTFALGRHPEIPSAMATPLRSFLGAAWGDPRVGGIAIGQTCGRYESLVDWNRSVADVLGLHAGGHHYEERWTGHDWGAWSDTLLFALASALGTPASGLCGE